LDVIHSAIQCARINRVDEVLLAMRWGDAARRKQVSELLHSLPVPVLLVPDQFIGSMPLHSVVTMGSLVAVEVQRAPLSRSELALKRALDMILAGSLLVALLPLLALVGIAIKLDSPGPIIFRQRRMGFNGEVFTIYKFRTMSVLEDGDTIKQATRADPRITRLGQLLRSTSIDELPQILNVLYGDMSLVGPRPHALAHDAEYSKLIGSYACRHHVKPGITGWAQINGWRGETASLEPMKKRVELDLWYIDNWSLWLDLQILFLTCFELLPNKKAY
jgi:undecaprenyl-phosphate galactose phosphotransferase/putative colanic acid biosynthesis UDP-glucose lipid carrier transferase